MENGYAVWNTAVFVRPTAQLIPISWSCSPVGRQAKYSVEQRRFDWSDEYISAISNL